MALLQPVVLPLPVNRVLWGKRIQLEALLLPRVNVLRVQLVNLRLVALAILELTTLATIVLLENFNPVLLLVYAVIVIEELML